MTEEIWKPVEGFDHPYEVSSLGRLRGPYGETHGHFNGGAFTVSLKRGGKQVCVQLKHLVANAFVPNPDGLPYVKEKDKNFRNCRADNLEWAARKVPERYNKEKKAGTAGSAAATAYQKGLMQKVPKCPRDCIHYGYWDVNVPCCDYLLNTGHRRPCPAGENCTVYKKGKRGKKALFQY